MICVNDTGAINIVPKQLIHDRMPNSRESEIEIHAIC